MQQLKDHLMIAAAALMTLIALQALKPDWAPVWAPAAGAALILAFLLWGAAEKQKAAAAKEAQEKKERRERHEKLEREKHQMTLDRKEAIRERRRKEKATKQEEANGMPADSRL